MRLIATGADTVAIATSVVSASAALLTGIAAILAVLFRRPPPDDRPKVDLERRQPKHRA